MNCPKCGFVQEDREDCLKCGVVFAKFYALHSLDGPVPADTYAHPEASPQPVPGPHPSEIDQLRQSVRDLVRRFNELDFERVERNRLRSEIRALDQKIEEGLGRLAGGLGGCERRLEETAARKDLEDLKAELESRRIDPIVRAAAQIEERLGRLQSEVAALADPRLLEAIRKLDARQAELEARFAELLAGGNGQDEPGTTVRIRPALKAIEELRASLESVTLRYSEIGELKKNHLVLLSRLEALEQSHKSTGQAAFQGLAGRVSDMEKEVAALRAEVRQAISRAEALQAAPARQVPDVQPLRAELAELHKIRSDESEKMRLALGALESKLNESLVPLSGLAERVQSLAGQIQRVEQRFQPAGDSSGGDGAAGKIADLKEALSSLQKDWRQIEKRLRVLESKMEAAGKAAPGPSESLSNSDVQVIRESLDEIRRFMLALHQKL